MGKSNSDPSGKREPGASRITGPAVLGALVGALIGSAVYTAHYASALSYLSDDPKACVNCHIMNAQYDGWAKGPHHARAVCNDCHVPNDSMVNKYLVKSDSGYRHSRGFTFQDFHEPIRMLKSSRDVVIANCIRCHDAMTHEIRLATGKATGADRVSGGLDCIHCHASVGHGPTR